MTTPQESMQWLKCSQMQIGHRAKMIGEALVHVQSFKADAYFTHPVELRR